MIGLRGGLCYDVEIPASEMPNYDGSRYITIDRNGTRYVSFVNATMPEEHYQMPKGMERYQDFKAHEQHARREAFNIAALAFPELEQIREQEQGLLPELWRFDLVPVEVSAQAWIDWTPPEQRTATTPPTRMTSFITGAGL